MNNTKHSLDTLLLAAIADRLSLLVWSKTKDGIQGINRPPSIMAKLLGKEEEKNVVSFETPDAFDAEWKKITGGKG